MKQQVTGRPSEISLERAQEVLYESEAALRLLDQELKSAHGLDDEDYFAGSLSPSVERLTIDAANAQLLAVLTRISKGRSDMTQPGSGDLAQGYDSGPAWSTLNDIEHQVTEIIRMFGLDGGTTGGTTLNLS